MWKVIRWGVIIVVVLFVAIQLIPFGRAHANPPVTAEPPWDTPQTRELAQRACFDCHSNETVWPLYSNIAPISWFVQHDVDEGRGRLNFSEWDRGQEADEAADLVREGEMPLKVYLPLHPQANLSSQEKEALIRGLEATFGAGG
jgi:mono/diheme cytochrome c family protein